MPVDQCEFWSFWIAAFESQNLKFSPVRHIRKMIRVSESANSNLFIYGLNNSNKYVRRGTSVGQCSRALPTAETSGRT